MAVVHLTVAKAERDLGVFASTERDQSGDLWFVLRSRKDNSVIAQARVPIREKSDRVLPEDQPGRATGSDVSCSVVPERYTRRLAHGSHEDATPGSPHD